MSEPLRRTCLGRTRHNAQCPREPVEGSAYCDRHDPESARARGRNGRAKQLAAGRADRAAAAAALVLATAADIRAALTVAVRLAYELDDPGTIVRACMAAETMRRAEELAGAPADAGSRDPVRLVWPEEASR